LWITLWIENPAKSTFHYIYNYKRGIGRIYIFKCLKFKHPLRNRRPNVKGKISVWKAWTHFPSKKTDWRFKKIFLFHNFFFLRITLKFLENDSFKIQKRNKRLEFFFGFISSSGNQNFWPCHACKLQPFQKKKKKKYFQVRNCLPDGELDLITGSRVSAERLTDHTATDLKIYFANYFLIRLVWSDNPTHLRRKQTMNFNELKEDKKKCWFCLNSKWYAITFFRREFTYKN